MDRSIVRLTISQKVSRAYAIWWDMINTGTIVLILSFSFFAFSIILIAGRMDLMPFEKIVWQQFIETVPPQKQSEIGIGILSVSVSAASAAALYLIRIGTARWAMNRRIGHIHAYFAEEILWRCNSSDCCHASLTVVLSSFIDSSLHVFEQISETHPRSQVFFEHARMKSHIVLRDKAAGNLDAIDIARDLYCAAILCQKSITLPNEASSLSSAIRKRLRGKKILNS